MTPRTFISKPLLALGLVLSLGACELVPERPVTDYACTLPDGVNPAAHPKAARYQAVLDDMLREYNGMGLTMYVKDAQGVWLGATGMADAEQGIGMQPCNSMMIASISKVFTAAVIYSLQDQGLLSIDDPLTQHLPEEYTKRVANADEATIGQCLNHTAGLPDYYTLEFELDRLNTYWNDWRQEDILKYTYGKRAPHKTGSTYVYSNTNYLILGILAEQVSGKSLAQLYDELVFGPLGLESGYYGTTTPFPADMVKGYADIYDNGQLAFSEFMYIDETNTADGGIVINAFDLGQFAEALYGGHLIGESSLGQMLTLDPLPEFWVWERLGQYENGYGTEVFDSDFGRAYGHTGGVDGFSTYLNYWPEHDATLVVLGNHAGSSASGRAFLAARDVMFEE